MSMDTPVNSMGDGLDEEVEEISVEPTEDNLVLLQGSDWELLLSPAEARELGQALIDTAKDVEDAG